jgi:hypothetical protein
MADLKLSGKRRKDRHKGAAKYLCYPEYTIHNLLGGKVLEADFVGRFITGRTKPVNFISFAFKKQPRLRYFQRIESQTAKCLKAECQNFFIKFEQPDFVKTDNGLAMIGSASGKRNLSQTMQFLLKRQVIPIFSVPRKPFSQASVEGNNSVFARMFWNKTIFKDIQEIDEKLEWFNESSESYCKYKRPNQKKKPNKDFIPKVYFIRQVKEEKDNNTACINVLNEQITLDKSYINYFVLAEWNLKEEKLYVRFEKDRQSNIIKTIPFKINSDVDILDLSVKLTK